MVPALSTSIRISRLFLFGPDVVGNNIPYSTYKGQTSKISLKTKIWM